MKFLVFISLVISIWYVMRWFQQEAAKRIQPRRRDERRGGRTMRATDTVVCSKCGAYVPADYPTACDRTGCPFPGVG